MCSHCLNSHCQDTARICGHTPYNPIKGKVYDMRGNDITPKIKRISCSVCGLGDTFVFEGGVEICIGCYEKLKLAVK